MNPTDEREAILGLICDRARSLIDAHWSEIREIADEPNDKGESGVIKFALSVELDFTGKTPAGAVNISYSRKYKDGATFRVEDSDQEKLPLDDTTVTMSTPGGKTTGPIPVAQFDAAIRKMSGKQAK